MLHARMSSLGVEGLGFGCSGFIGQGFRVIVKELTANDHSCFKYAPSVIPGMVTSTQLSFSEASEEALVFTKYPYYGSNSCSTTATQFEVTSPDLTLNGSLHRQ